MRRRTRRRKEEGKERDRGEEVTRGQDAPSLRVRAADTDVVLRCISGDPSSGRSTRTAISLLAILTLEAYTSEGRATRSEEEERNLSSGALARDSRGEYFIIAITARR